MSQTNLKEQVLEIYYQNQCIEQRVYSPPNLIAPSTGEQFTILFHDPSLTEEYGSRWIVRERRHILAGASDTGQTIQLFCEPLS